MPQSDQDDDHGHSGVSRRHSRRSASPIRNREDHKGSRQERSPSRQERQRDHCVDYKKEESDNDDRRRSSRRDHNRSRSRSRRGSRKDSSRHSSKKKSRKEKKSRRRHRDDSSSESRSRSPRAAADRSNTLDVTRQQREFTTYSNVDNPFNDANLEQRFVWGKKIHQESKRGIDARERERRDRERREESRIELEKLRRKREERDNEMQLREQEQLRMQRDADIALLGDWEAKEEQFHLEQAKRRAGIRIKSGRAKPIDVLAINIRLVDGSNEDEADEDELEDEEAAGLEVNMEEPYRIFDSLDLSEIIELQQDIQYYLSLEKTERNKEFWQAMQLVCNDEIERLKGTNKNGHDPRAVGRSSVTSVVATDVQALLAGKTLDQLGQLQQQIERKLKSNEPIDVDYWERVLKALIVAKAKAKLDGLHQEMLLKRLEKLRELQRRQAEKNRQEIEKTLRNNAAAARNNATSGEMAAATAREALVLEMEGASDNLMLPIEPYVREMSPVPWPSISRFDKDLLVVDAAQDIADLKLKREQVQQRQFVPKTVAKPQQVQSLEPDDLASEMFRLEMDRGLDEDEEIFNLEEQLNTTTYQWQDKYRPRKPRYFNRVNTGFEWNKYNQTHYDFDNPPPKVVQGYKFNIFYPDLIDKSKSPTYVVEKDSSNPETAVIRFIAGPPYEEIAFRIVNREWEYSHKKGFRSKFDRGVLQLHFHFKRHFYRR
ncbi:mid region of cactin-domain-containing protein [Syncephalis fuscata]|nr:mid region of cactin-domain-containing protein [Syncephalis fuscata]